MSKSHSHGTAIYGTLVGETISHACAVREDGAIVGRNSGVVFDDIDVATAQFVTYNKTRAAAMDAGVAVNMIAGQLKTAKGRPSSFGKTLSSKKTYTVAELVDHYVSWGGVSVEDATTIKANIVAFYAATEADFVAA